MISRPTQLRRARTSLLLACVAGGAGGGRAPGRLSARQVGLRRPGPAATREQRRLALAAGRGREPGARRAPTGRGGHRPARRATAGASGTDRARRAPPARRARTGAAGAAGAGGGRGRAARGGIAGRGGAAGGPERRGGRSERLQRRVQRTPGPARTAWRRAAPAQRRLHVHLRLGLHALQRAHHLPDGDACSITCPAGGCSGPIDCRERHQLQRHLRRQRLQQAHSVPRQHLHRHLQRDQLLRGGVTAAGTMTRSPARDRARARGR